MRGASPHCVALVLLAPLVLCASRGRAAEAACVVVERIILQHQLKQIDAIMNEVWSMRPSANSIGVEFAARARQFKVYHETGSFATISNIWMVSKTMTRLIRFQPRWFGFVSLIRASGHLLHARNLWDATRLLAPGKDVHIVSEALQALSLGQRGIREVLARRRACAEPELFSSELRILQRKAKRIGRMTRPLLIESSRFSKTAEIEERFRGLIMVMTFVSVLASTYLVVAHGLFAQDDLARVVARVAFAIEGLAAAFFFEAAWRKMNEAQEVFGEFNVFMQHVSAGIVSAHDRYRV